VAGWDPQQYMRFGDERTQPSVDLVARIKLDNPASIVDLGCGPGNSTRVLKERWPLARVTGLDSSREMIDRARKEYPDGEWIVGDAAEVPLDHTFDLVFSNATLQWIPDHEALVPRLFRTVNPGGALAVQVPANQESPLHRALVSVAEKPEWRQYTARCDNLLHYHTGEYYYGLLYPLTTSTVLWETTYFHILESQRDIVEWYKGTGMRPYLESLPDDARRAAFENEVLEACRSSYPVQGNGKVLYPFKRVFFIAYK
jgi:trans-aconitate 2-methyltransferase